jgi:mRNA interferase MazF
MTASPGEIWVADIPFTVQTGFKARPVLILWLDAQDAVVASITTASPRSSTDIALHDWRAAGLRAPSTVRLSRLATLDSDLLQRCLGRVTDADAQRLKDAWDKYVKPQF